MMNVEKSSNAYYVTNGAENHIHVDVPAYITSLVEDYMHQEQRITLPGTGNILADIL